MDWRVVAILVIALIAASLIKKLGKASAPTYSYRKRDNLFSAAERSFYGVLTQAVEDKFSVFGKVRVADVISPAKGLSKQSWRGAFNRISSKHFDFVLCDRSTLAVNCVVELNDKSHSRTKRVKRDEFLRRTCESAGLRLVEVPASASYSVSEIRQLILET